MEIIASRCLREIIVLDVQDRRRRHVRATPQPFTVVANQTVHVDMNIDTGIR